MTYLERAIKDGYAYLSGTESKQKITCTNNVLIVYYNTI